MANDAGIGKRSRRLGSFDKYLTVWVFLCIVAGIGLGRLAPGAAKFLDGLAVYSKGAPVVSIPIAVCLFFMMLLIMGKIDFREVIAAGRSVKPVGLTLFVNWAIKPFTMYAFASGSRVALPSPAPCRPGHLKGEAFKAVLANEVDAGRRIIGTDAPHPLPFNIPAGFVERFRRQISLIDLQFRGLGERAPGCVG